MSSQSVHSVLSYVANWQPYKKHNLIVGYNHKIYTYSNFHLLTKKKNYFYFWTVKNSLVVGGGGGGMLWSDEKMPPTTCQ